MSNLIERLRNWCPPDEPDTDEAADEIERLEGVIDAIKHYCYSGGTQVITIQRIIEQDL